jgi:hypothetical protein
VVSWSAQSSKWRMRPSSLVCTIFLPNVLATGKIVQRLNNLITTKLESLLHRHRKIVQGVISVIGFLSAAKQEEMPDVAGLALAKGAVVRGQATA